jgi:asparagine synthase (glutamine-hydrolysing)
MCGFAGVARREPRGVEREQLERMAAAVRHRGPDGSGVLADARVGLAHARLSVIDVAGGAQPMADASGRYWIVYNGEIFNFPALKTELEGRGCAFRTRSDTEVLLHGYAQWGEALLDRLNGQFAFVIYDRETGALFLARDRFGILPLFYAERRGDLFFGSEVKALFASGEVERALDPAGLDEVFTFWGARPPRTPFLGVRALEPGCYARWRAGRLTVRRWYALDYAPERAEPATALARLDELLRSSVSHRLLADIPVGGYLSGGLDSSSICALAAGQSPAELRTFSVAFADPHFDESAHQAQLAAAVKSRRHPHRRRRHRRGVPRRRAARRVAAGAHRARAPVSAVAARARARHHRDAVGRRRGRVVLRLRPVQGSGGAAVLPAPARVALAATAVRPPVRLSRPG